MPGLDEILLEKLLEARSVLVLTGAGMSAESGIPTFREAQTGLWAQYRPEELATPEAFREHPARVWRWYEERRAGVRQARPHAGHRALVELAALLPAVHIVTQNVDGLHQMAGSRDVIEFHGNFAWQRCMECNNRCETTKIDIRQIPPRCECGGIYKPECIFFGEMIPPQYLRRSEMAASACDTMLVIGTSAGV